MAKKNAPKNEVLSTYLNETQNSKGITRRLPLPMRKRRAMEATVGSASAIADCENSVRPAPTTLAANHTGTTDKARDAAISGTKTRGADN